MTNILLLIEIFKASYSYAIISKTKNNLSIFSSFSKSKWNFEHIKIEDDTHG